MSDLLPSSKCIELITIGREILDGRIVDTNSVDIAQELAERSLNIRYAQKVDDIREDIIGSFKIAASRSQWILVTGGLGPTSDDITLSAFADFIGKSLEKNSKAMELLSALLKERGGDMSAAQEKQCWLPSGSEVIPNPNGTAAGCAYKLDNGSRFFFMPGVPSEMLPMLKTHVLPQLPAGIELKKYRWATHFTAESKLQDSLQAVVDQLPEHFELNFRTRFPENHVALFANCHGLEDGALFDVFQEKITQILQKDCYFHGTELQELPESLVALASKQNVGICATESCTGGLVSAAFTSVGGSSACFLSGWVTYDNEAKKQLGVSAELLDKHGAVSEEVSRAMAESALEKLKAMGSGHKRLLSVSTTGIAGPSGGSEEKPVGLCYASIADSHGETVCWKIHARPGLSRALYQKYFTQKALELVRQRLH